jgi:hypothetical protein
MKSDIAIVVYDYLGPEFDDIRANLTDLVLFKTQGARINCPVFQTTSITNTIKEVYKQGFTWAVVVAVGTWVTQSQDILNTVKHMEETDASLAGHILSKGGYYYFHPQWFGINLRVWNKIGCPAFETRGGVQTYNGLEILRSSENVHDDYTPLWLKAGTDQKTYITDSGYFGSRVISELINNNYSVVNIPDSIRDQKKYAYPEFNHDNIVKILNDPTYEPGTTGGEGGLWWFNKAISEAKTKYLNVGYYALNTESFANNRDLSATSLDCFIGVCGGLKPSVIAGADNFVDNSTVYFIDVSRAALDWQQYLVEKRDGDFSKFESIFHLFQLKNPDYVRTGYDHTVPLEDDINWFLQSCKLTREEFYQRWQKYKKYKFNYVKLNLLESTSAYQILEYTQSSQLGTYIWTSNSFYMDYLMFYKTKKGAEAIQQEFIDTLASKTQVEIFLENNGWIYSYPPICKIIMSL